MPQLRHASGYFDAHTAAFVRRLCYAATMPQPERIEPPLLERRAAHLSPSYAFTA